MFSSLWPSNAAGEMILLAAVCLGALAFSGFLYNRQLARFDRLSTALDNMSQGLNVFDARGRVTLLNRRYLEMYKLSPDIVKPGSTLVQLLQIRRDTGLFKGDVEAYCRKIMDEVKQGKPMAPPFQASDG